MKDTIEANLKAKAKEKINAPNIADTELFVLSWRNVLGKGAFTTVIVEVFPDIKFMYVSIANV